MLYSLPYRPCFASVCSTVGVLTLAISAATASAGTIHQYSGIDNGAPVDGPFPNSSAAQSVFLSAAAAYGKISSITFEGDPVGFSTLGVTVAPGVTEAQSGPDLGNGASGISNESFASPSIANLYGFNTTTGGSYFLGIIEDTTTFTFGSPTHSFGFYATGLQTSSSTTISLAFNDGSNETLDFLDVPTQGGAAYYGFTDTSSFSSITLTDTPGTDFWGIDDVSYNSPITAVTPEPSSLLLLGTGLLAASSTARKRWARS